MQEAYFDDGLLQAAFNFRKAELWFELSDNDIFATLMPSGKMGYCSVMGNGGTYYGMGLYTGTEGFSTYWRMMKADRLEDIDAYNIFTTFDVLNINFSQANNMNFGIKEPIRTFAKKNGFSIPRKLGWPEFVRMKPFRDLRPLNDPVEAHDMQHALEAATYMAKLLKEKTPRQLGFTGKQLSRFKNFDIPLLTLDDKGEWTLSTTPLPKEEPFTYPQPLFSNEAAAAKLKAKRKKGSLECTSLRLRISLEVNDENVAPFMVVMRDTQSGLLVNFSLCEHPYDERPEALLEPLIVPLIDQPVPPSIIYCNDELTAGLLHDFCLKTGIRQVLKKRSDDFTFDCYSIMDQF